MCQKVLFVCRGSFDVVHINLSGTEVLDWCVDELLRRVNDRVTGGEFTAIVV